MSTTDTLIRSARFRKEREPGWLRLETLVGRVEKRGVHALSFTDAQDMAALYRQAMTSLSLAREISLDKGLLAYLEALCARAYLAVYAPQESLRGLVSRLFLEGFPQAVRRSILPLIVGLLTIALGFAAGYLLFFDDQTWYNTLMPEGMAQGRGLASSREDLLAVIYDEAAPPSEALAAFASFLFSNNTRIAIFIFSLGVLICVPSFILTFYNGLMLGAFFGLHVDRGIGYDLFAWLSIHGVTEIGAIIVACAGGLKLGLAVLFPGQMTRRDALRHAGRDATKLALLAAFMLVVAAVLEGFFRQLVQDPETRIVIGWGIGLIWIAYWTFAGRNWSHAAARRRT
jgi:uncharacterized membrane protein SpoIIM required for sporulation